MDELEILKLDINSLTKAHNKIENALNILAGIDDFSEKDFRELSDISEIINDLRIKKEVEFDRLEELENG